MTQQQVDYCRGKARVIVINTTWEKAPWADLLYACDFTWWQEYGGLPHFEGLKYTQDDCALVFPTITYVRSVNKPGLSFNRAIIHQGANSGYQAINLAVHFGVKRIILLGYDMQNGEDGECHHHGPHPGDMPNPKPAEYKRWKKNFGTMEPDLKRAGVEVVNCTPNSALRCFPTANLEDVL